MSAAKKHGGSFIEETSFRQQINSRSSNFPSTLRIDEFLQNPTVNNNNSIANNDKQEERDARVEEEGEEANTQLDHSTLLAVRNFEEETDEEDEEQLWCSCSEKRQAAVILMSCLTIILAVSIVSAIVYIRIFVQPIHGIHHGHGHHHANKTKGPIPTTATSRNFENNNGTILANSTRIVTKHAPAVEIDLPKNSSSTTTAAPNNETTSSQTTQYFLEGRIHR